MELHTQVEPLSELRQDNAFCAAILDLLAPSYEDPSAIMKRELAHCDTVYMAFSEDGRMESFFMVGHEVIDVEAQSVSAVYLGLSATREELKSGGAGRAVYARWQAEDADLRQRSVRPLVVWCTTATPLVYLFITKLQPTAEPFMDGSYTPRWLSFVNASRQRLGLPEAVRGGHPFLLKAVARDTRYSVAEELRIREICRTRGFSLFDKVGLDQGMGDRLLVVGDFPSRCIG